MSISLMMGSTLATALNPTFRSQGFGVSVEPAISQQRGSGETEGYRDASSRSRLHSPVGIVMEISTRWQGTSSNTPGSHCQLGTLGGSIDVVEGGPVGVVTLGTGVASLPKSFRYPLCSRDEQTEDQQRVSSRRRDPERLGQGQARLARASAKA